MMAMMKALSSPGELSATCRSQKIIESDIGKTGGNVGGEPGNLLLGILDFSDDAKTLILRLLADVVKSSLHGLLRYFTKIEVFNNLRADVITIENFECLILWVLA